jgi:hypothetical protein
MPFAVVAVSADEEVCCPKCGNRLPVGLNAFCDWCGHPLFREVKRSNWVRLPDRSFRWCYRCGRRVVGGPCRGHRRGTLCGVRDGRRIHSDGGSHGSPG